MFGKKDKEPNPLIDKLRMQRVTMRTNAAKAMEQAKTIVELDAVGISITSDNFPEADDRRYLINTYEARRMELGAAMATGPKTPDNRDTFTINLDNITRTLANMAKRRAWLEEEIAKLSLELYQINVSTDAFETASGFIADHANMLNNEGDDVSDGEIYAKVSRGNVPDEVVAEAFETAAAAMEAELAQDAFGGEETELKSLLPGDQTEIVRRSTARRASHKANTDD